MEVSDKYIKQYRLSNRFINHANTYIAQLQSFRLEFLQIQLLPNTNDLSEWCLGMAHVFSYIYGMVTTTIEHTIHRQIYLHDIQHVCHCIISYVTASTIITTTITTHQVFFGLLSSILQGHP